MIKHDGWGLRPTTTTAGGRPAPRTSRRSSRTRRQDGRDGAADLGPKSERAASSIGRSEGMRPTDPRSTQAARRKNARDRARHSRRERGRRRTRCPTPTNVPEMQQPRPSSRRPGKVSVVLDYVPRILPVGEGEQGEVTKRGHYVTRSDAALVLPRPLLYAVVEALGLEQKDVLVEGPAARWQRGTLVMQPAERSLQPQEVPLKTFFHKIVIIGKNLRVLEQKVNASDPPSPRLRCAKQAERCGQVRPATIYHPLLRIAHHVQNPVQKQG